MALPNARSAAAASIPLAFLRRPFRYPPLATVLSRLRQMSRCNRLSSSSQLAPGTRKPWLLFAWRAVGAIVVG